MAKGVKTHKLDELDIMDLRVILAISKLNCTQKAATQLGVTRSMVIYRLQLVENYFQQPVYYRYTKGDSITPFGKIVAQYAESVIDLYTELMLFGRNYKKQSEEVAK